MRRKSQRRGVVLGIWGRYTRHKFLRESGAVVFTHNTAITPDLLSIQRDPDIHWKLCLVSLLCADSIQSFLVCLLLWLTWIECSFPVFHPPQHEHTSKLVDCFQVKEQRAPISLKTQKAVELRHWPDAQKVCCCCDQTADAIRLGTNKWPVELKNREHKQGHAPLVRKKCRSDFFGWRIENKTSKEIDDQPTRTRTFIRFACGCF